MISKNGIKTVIKNSRWYSSDMTVFSCLVCFLYALSAGGNVVNGIIAFIGILFAHMAANLYDDYDDYKLLCTDARFSEFTPDVKCAYLKNGSSTLKDLAAVIVIYCLIALITGFILFLRAGYPVLFLAAAGGLIVLNYPKFSRAGLSEIAVGTAFGPLLFEGMYFVMTKTFSFEVFILSLAVVMFTVGVMYVHTLLDYESDRVYNKKTLVRLIGSKKMAMLGFIMIYLAGYIFLTIFSLMIKNYFCLLAFMSVPFVFLLYKALKSYDSSGFYARNELYLSVLVGSAKVMALFSFFIAIGLFINLFTLV